jgi:hypothetical protein
MRSTYAEQRSTKNGLRTFKKIYHLRKIKMFVHTDKITLVTYFRNYTHSHDEYVGNAYTFNFKNRTLTIVTLAHTNHAPPEQDERKEEKDVDTEDEEINPLGIGAQLIYA